MKLAKRLSLLAMATLVFACSKNEEVEKNMAPEISAQAFTAQEDLDAGSQIGTIKATDADKDNLSFTLTTNSNALFALTADGKLSLASGKSLDYETTTSHSLEVQVSDGEETAKATVTVTVVDVDENTAPTAAAQAFTVAEDIADDAEIGTVTATDAEGDALSFSIKTDADALFEITDDGKLSLQNGKALDYETKTSHQVTISVTDGNLSTDVSITINVTDVDENAVTVPNTRPFIINVDMNLLPGDAPQYSLYFAAKDKSEYDVVIDWGDGTLEKNAFQDTETASYLVHTYANRQTYKIKIYGKFPSMATDTKLIVGIEQWGDIEWESMENMFNGSINLSSYTATDAPNLSKVTSMHKMFLNCEKFNADLNNWNVSTITNMDRMFARARNFNGNISNWNVSKVTNMNRMFQVASSFNQDLSNWNVAEVNNMYAMFELASNFNQNISSWNVGKVQTMSLMFSGATAFSQDLSGWNTANVTSCTNFGKNSGLTSAQLPTIGCFSL
ncbi:MAG: BspA family leucine-rich repeat surface protein [Flavobacteriaceae bacterium]|nr:BspA family leucine-rich repeat surface protein [Flavobacteriaceae bacterium]